jgi:hypothetical protein
VTRFVTFKLATVILPIVAFAVAILLDKSITNGVAQLLIVAVLPDATPTPIRKFVLVCIEILGMFADIVIVPVCLFCPRPGPVITCVTPDEIVVVYKSVKFCCTFSKAVLIASAPGSFGKEPKSIFCCAILYHLI